MNKDEAERCITIAVTAYNNGDIDRANKFLNKSISLHPTDKANEWINKINNERNNSSSNNKGNEDNNTPNSFDNTKESHSNGSENIFSSFSNWWSSFVNKQLTENEASVKRVLSCSSHYEVLGIDRNAKSSEIKKSYFQYARQLHPDKNTEHGADEAFKVLSVAYETLKDPNLREQYDKLLDDGHGNINTSHLKQKTIKRLSKDDGKFKYYIIQRFYIDFLQEIVKERILSPQTWPWANPAYFLQSFILIAVIISNIWNLYTGFFISSILHLIIGWIIYTLIYYIPYLNYMFYITIIIAILPHYYYLKNRIKLYWKIILLVLVVAFIFWKLIGFNFIFTCLVLSSFGYLFLLPLLPKNKIVYFVFVVFNYFYLCNSQIFMYICYILLLPILLRIFTITRSLKPEQERENNFFNDNRNNNHNHTHSHSHNDSHQHNHSHSHTHSHSHSHSHNTNNRNRKKLNKYPYKVPLSNINEYLIVSKKSIYYHKGTERKDVTNVTNREAVENYIIANNL